MTPSRPPSPTSCYFFLATTSEGPWPLPRRRAKALGQPGDRARVQAAAPRFREAERGRHLIETLPLEIMPANQRALVLRQIFERVDHELPKLGLGHGILR